MGKKILVVDDEKAIVKGLKYSLIQDGFEVDEAYDGEEALNKCSLVKYDAILLDLMLPKISGMEVLQPRARIWTKSSALRAEQMIILQNLLTSLR